MVDPLRMLPKSTHCDLADQPLVLATQPTPQTTIFQPVDVLGLEDFIFGTIIALVLAFAASFLQSRRNQNDFVLWQTNVDIASNATVADTSLSSNNANNDTTVFDAN